MTSQEKISRTKVSTREDIIKEMEKWRTKFNSLLMAKLFEESIKFVVLDDIRINLFEYDIVISQDTYPIVDDIYVPTMKVEYVNSDRPAEHIFIHLSRIASDEPNKINIVIDKLKSILLELKPSEDYSEKLDILIDGLNLRVDITGRPDLLSLFSIESNKSIQKFVTNKRCSMILLKLEGDDNIYVRVQRDNFQFNRSYSIKSRSVKEIYDDVRAAKAAVIAATKSYHTK